MPPILCNAKALRIGSTRWTVIVQVLERYLPMIKKGYTVGDGKRYQKFVLLDMEGTLISAVMHDSAIQPFSHLLEPYKRYKISNARLEDVYKEFRISDYNYQWTISLRTPIELVEDFVPRQIECPYQLVPFSDLYKHADKNHSINTMGLLVHRNSETKTTNGVPIKKFTMLTPEKIPVNLTIWLNDEVDCSTGIDETVTLPICVLAKNLRVSTYEGISLSSQKYSYLMLNPPMAEAASLLHWFASSEIETSLWKPDNKCKNPRRFYHMPSQEEILPLKNAVENIFTLRTVWVRGQLRYNSGSRGPCTVVCSTCKKALDAEPADMMTCMFCNTYSLTELSLRLSFQLSDESASILVSTNSPVADLILSMSAEEMQQTHDQNLLATRMEETLNNKLYTCLIKVFYTNFRQQKIPHYSLLHFYVGELHDRSSSSSGLETTQTQNPSVPNPKYSPPGTPTFVNPTVKAFGKSDIPAAQIRKRLDFNESSSDTCDPKANADNIARKKGKTE